MLFQVLISCHADRFLSDEEQMLERVDLVSRSRNVKAGDYRLYVRQEANSRWFNLVKAPLGIYCLSGRDSTKRVNRLLRRIGQAPVVYDTAQTNASVRSLRSALQARGYLHANVGTSTRLRSHRVRLTYTMSPGVRWYVNRIDYEADDSLMLRKLKEACRDSRNLYEGMPLDVSLITQERDRVIRYLQERGYFDLNKDFITFTADTVAGENNVRLAVRLACPAGVSQAKAYRTYTVGSLTITETTNLDSDAPTDTLRQGDVRLASNGRLLLHPKVYDNHVAIRTGELYNEQDVQDTYASLGSLRPVDYATVRFFPSDGDTAATLDAQVGVKLGDKYTISAELDGTNTSGDFGAALSLNFLNRNLFRGAEALTLKLRGAYEAIEGLEGYSNQNYVEYGAEATLRMPTFKFPLLPRRVNRNLRAVSELNLMYNSQNRPEFHRRVLTARWGYNWGHHDRPRLQHTLDLVSLNYVFLPWISKTFEERYLEGTNPRYSILRNSYENLFIMRTGYGLTYTKRRDAANASSTGTADYAVRFNIETAGNLLYAFANLTKLDKDAGGQYKIFNIAFSQYAKADLDLTKTITINDHNALALHAAAGVAIPYGNSSIIPYEKRYFAGGANGVRGWNVRELGPGNYSSTDGKVNFINQTGNFSLLLSAEYRTQMFWKFSGAAFIDAGNIWNTRYYENIPGGQFKFHKALNQLAVAYGLGLRFNLDYFIIRFDAGMKAVNPAKHGNDHYPLLHPVLSRDFSLHFAVGLPF